MVSDSPQTRQALPARLRDYVAIARPDHWIKHLFIVPGIVTALLLRGATTTNLWSDLVFGFVSASAIASANYVINEWLDRKDDAHHPVKSARPAVTRKLSPTGVYGEYLGLLALGLFAASRVCEPFFVTTVCFAISGLVYNVPPLRSKDRAYLDVLTESFNNPVRLVLGWTMVDQGSLPPASLLLAYWMGGAFLMATKRLAEYRNVADTDGVEALVRYRRSFRRYDHTALLLSSVTYALMSSFFLAVFLVKYRIEYLLSIPLFTAMFVEYLRLGLSSDSPVQAPERLHLQGRLWLIALALVVALALLTWVDLPFLERLMEPHYIEFGA